MRTSNQSTLASTTSSTSPTLSVRLFTSTARPVFLVNKISHWNFFNVHYDVCGFRGSSRCASGISLKISWCALRFYDFHRLYELQVVAKKWLVPGFHAEIHVVHEIWMSLPLTFQRDALRLPPYSYPFVCGDFFCSHTWWDRASPSPPARFLPGFQEVQVTIVHWAPRNAATLSVSTHLFFHKETCIIQWYSYIFIHFYCANLQLYALLILYVLWTVIADTQRP